VTQELLVFWPALVAGAVVAATHVPLGVQVLQRGIVFIDLAVAQMAGLGVVLAGWLGMEASGAGMQLTALCAALAGALFFTWTERHWPEVQEAVIGVVFILAANAAILLLAANPHGAEHLKDLLVGQILWVTPTQVGWAALASIVVILLLNFTQGRLGFYLLFACAVTVSVQLVGMYLVFASLIVPALATRRAAAGIALCIAGYAAGLALSVLTDLPAGPLIVCTMVMLAFCVNAIYRYTRNRSTN
jgi:zinc/manganese transport system permease protein